MKASFTDVWVGEWDGQSGRGLSCNVDEVSEQRQRLMTYDYDYDITIGTQVPVHIL